MGHDHGSPLKNLGLFGAVHIVVKHCLSESRSLPVK